MKSWMPALTLTGVGFFIAACVIGGLLGGQWLDQKLNTEPVFLITGIILGIALAFFGVYDMIKSLVDNIRKGGDNS